MAVGGLWCFAINIICVALALALGLPQPPYSLDPTGIGRYSLAGLLGLRRAPAHRTAHRPVQPGHGDHRRHAGRGSRTALSATGLGTPPATALGLALVDAGCLTALTPLRSGRDLPSP
ncbi:hypothetical protein FB563_7803 [Streptomyces puniciscabiei]|uniref:Uncharacterized protein n=1 Tax=Streptomyces puniciscabiei TaxID=164348 RepID=A0A542SZH8_9ACTN|nr:hypothetical protein FB563_7803 [Streptomyces puniciscabiei]